MVLPAEAGVRVAAAQVTMVIDEVRRIANHTMQQLSTDAHDGKSSFADVDTALGQFGDVPKARALGAHHQAAHEIFVQTYQGIIEDLVAFRDNLLACAESHQANDEQVQAALLRLGRSYGHHDFSSDAQHQQSTDVHHNDLYDAGQAEGVADTGSDRGSDHGGQSEPETNPSDAAMSNAGDGQTGGMR